MWLSFHVFPWGHTSRTGPVPEASLFHRKQREEPFPPSLETSRYLGYGWPMRRYGIHIPAIVPKAATVVIALLFVFQGIGVSFSSALPETKSRASVLKSQGSSSQYETKKSLKLVAAPKNAACLQIASTASSTVSRRSRAVSPPLHAAVPARAPPAPVAFHPSALA